VTAFKEPEATTHNTQISAAKRAAILQVA